MFAVSRRSAVVERLRRLLFSPSKMLAVGALALTFATSEPASAQMLTMPNFNISVAENGGLLYLADWYAYNDPSQTYDSTITLDGGTIALSTSMTAPVYDAETKTLHMWGLFDENLFAANAPEEEALSAQYMVDMYNGLGFDLEATYGGPIEKIVEHKGHFLDMSDGGVLYLFNSQQSVDDKRGQFADMCGLCVSPQEINGDFTLSGGGALLFLAGDTTYAQDGDQITAETTYAGKTVVNGATTIIDSAAFVHGDSEFNGSVFVYGESALARLDVNSGDHVFRDVVVALNGALDFRGEDGGKVVLEKDALISGGALYSVGAVEYQGNVQITGYNASTLAMFTRTIMDDNPDGTATFGENSVVSLLGTPIYNGSTVVGYSVNAFANVDCLKTDVSLFDAALTYCNVDQQTQDFGLANKFYVTYDENQTPTFLEWEAGRSNIENALANGNAINRDINGFSGHLAFATIGSQYVAPGETANGYTVVIDAKNQDDYDYKMFDYYGDTFVTRAFTVIQGDTNFGANGGNNKFSVWGETYFQLSDDGADGSLWSVESCGMLGFTRGDETDPTKAPSVTASSVQFNNGYDYEYNVGDAYDGRTIEQIVTGGARLWIDTSYRDADGNAAQIDRKLGAIHADNIVFGDQMKIWYDGISSVDSDVALTFELDADKIKLDSSEYEAGIVNSNMVDATPEDVENLFGAAQLVDATFAQTSADSAAGVVTVRAKDVADYAAEQKMSERERELAAKLDGARLEGGRALGFYDALYNETDETKVRQTIHNLSLLGYNMLNAQGHFGNPTSSFFGGSSVSGEAKRGQDVERDWTPEPQPKQKSEIAKPSNDYNPSRNVWAAYTHTAVDGDAYDFGGVTTHGYKLRRDGVVGGIRRQIDATTSGGLFFGLSSPEVQSANALEGGYGVVGSAMEMTDFQFAGHFEKVLADVWELAVYVGGGTQSMDWERFANFGPDAGGFYQYEAEGSGNTFTGTIYLSYRADVNNALTLRPTIGVDSEHSWLYGFSETATLAGAGSGSVLLNPYMDMFAQNYTYAKTYYNRNTARAGLSLAYTDPRCGLIGLNGRVFYGVKLGGDDAPELTYYSDAYRWDDMASHEMGDSSLNVGGGGFMHLNRQKTLTATGDVNAIWYKNAQTFNVTGGVSYRF